MAPLYKPSHIEWISSSLREKKEQILERQKKFTGSEKNGGKNMGINQFLDTEPHPHRSISCVVILAGLWLQKKELLSLLEGLPFSNGFLTYDAVQP